MEAPIKHYNRAEYIETVSKRIDVNMCPKILMFSIRTLVTKSVENQ